MEFVFQKVENIVEKGENVFSPFPTVFSKGFFFSLILTLIVVKHETNTSVGYCSHC